MPALSESDGEFIKIATTEGEKKGVSGNADVCQTTQSVQLTKEIKCCYL